MTWRILKSLSGFRRSEGGSVAVEFAITVPALLMILMSTVELGLVTIRQSQLERALDLTVRDIRLSTGTGLQHDAIRDSICARSGFIENCAASLRLEMIRLDPFNASASGLSTFAPLEAKADCVNRIEEVQPVRSFVNGQSNELMFLRACMKFNPVFPAWGLGRGLEKDADGRVSLFASTAFVQEPN